MKAVRLDLPQSEIVLWDDFLPIAIADQLFTELQTDIAWQQRSITLFGKTIPQPRLVAWYGDPGASYTYSGLTWEPLDWTGALRSLKQQVETATQRQFSPAQFPQAQFNSVLLNLYRHGQDSMGWHSDDEPELGDNPVIASVSLGATRRFSLKHKQRKDLKHRLDLRHGSLLVMAGETQRYWKHQVAKTTTVQTARINLTFRYVKVGFSG